VAAIAAGEFARKLKIRLVLIRGIAMAALSLLAYNPTFAHFLGVKA